MHEYVNHKYYSSVDTLNFAKVYTKIIDSVIYSRFVVEIRLKHQSSAMGFSASMPVRQAAHQRDHDYPHRQPKNLRCCLLKTQAFL